MKEIKLGDMVLGALKHVWATLEPLGLPMAVMGGIAVSFWEHLRATRDVDLLIQIEAGALDKMLGVLGKAGIRAKSNRLERKRLIDEVVGMLFSNLGELKEESKGPPK